MNIGFSGVVIARKSVLEKSGINPDKLNGANATGRERGKNPMIWYRFDNKHQTTQEQAMLTKLGLNPQVHIKQDKLTVEKIEEIIRTGSVPPIYL